VEEFSKDPLDSEPLARAEERSENDEEEAQAIAAICHVIRVAHPGDRAHEFADAARECKKGFLPEGFRCLGFGLP
jgi:hypothetical protein